MAQYDVYKFDMQFVVNAYRASTSFYYAQNEVDASSGRVIAENLRPALEALLWGTYLQQVAAPETYLVNTKCQLYAPTKDTPAINLGPDTTGLGSPGALPNVSAQVVTKYPGFWDRDFICRNYYPGMPETQYYGGKALQTFLDIFQPLADAAELFTVPIATPEALTFDQVCFSSKRWKAFDPQTQSITECYSKVNSVNPTVVLGTQRRRRAPRHSGPG